MLRLPPFARGRSSRPLLAVTALALGTLPTATHAQTTGSTSAGATQPPSARLTAADIKVLAETHVAISVVNDSAETRAAQSKNKTKEAQIELAHQKRAQLAEVIKAKGLSESEYQRQRFLVSTDADLRAQFDSVVAKLTGAPLPGRVTAAAAPGFFPASELPAGLVGTHVGHVSTSYVDTPDKSGLLPMAFAEAQIATQHANLAMRTPMDLAAMQMHAGHVLHALDPSIVAMGPGKGYGFRKAAGGVAQHIELAAKEPSASGNVKIHATHIAGAARSALARMELAIELAKKIRDAKDAATASSLLGQLVSMCGQLTAGSDVNADGRIDWGNGEGGLQQAQDHVRLLLSGERR